MSDPLVGVVLAAGRGKRLRPLTDLIPKPLCPVNNVPLIDLRLRYVTRVARDVAVNVHYGRELLEEHLEGRAYLSIEEPEALGTAGALGKLRDWIAGRDVLVANADSWHEQDLSELVAGWDRTSIRLLCVRDPERGDFGHLRYCGTALMPWSAVSKLAPEPSGLFETSWAQAAEAGRLDLVVSDSPFFDCGTLADYHAANMAASGGHNVIGSGAVVDGSIERTVLWPGVHVMSDERLIDAVRPRNGLTLFARAGEPADVR